MADNVMAATQPPCARPDERVAVDAAARQQLIFTALACDTAHGYNSAVLAFLWLIKEKARTEEVVRTRGSWRASASSSVVAQAQTAPVMPR